jgi:hypothetical protein
MMAVISLIDCSSSGQYNNQLIGQPRVCTVCVTLITRHAEAETDVLFNLYYIVISHFIHRHITYALDLLNRENCCAKQFRPIFDVLNKQ